MIDEAAALATARERATQQGWAFLEPGRVITRRTWWRGTITRYEIQSNALGKGPIARFVVDAQTGAILEEGFVPR